MSKREGGFSGGLAYMVSDDERGQPEELYSVLRHADGWHVAMEGIPGSDDAIAARIESWGGVSVRLQPSGAGMTTEAVDADGLVFCFSQETDGSPTVVFGLVADQSGQWTLSGSRNRDRPASRATPSPRWWTRTPTTWSVWSSIEPTEPRSESPGAWGQTPGLGAAGGLAPRAAWGQTP